VPRSEIRALNPSQAIALLGAVRDSEFGPAITTALYSGPRLGELLGLRWSDVDLDGAAFSIQQTVQRLEGGKVIFTATKTHRSRRRISLPQALIAVLRQHRARQLEERLRAGFKGALASVGLPVLRLHDLRHSMATLMLSQGEHPKVVSERLGRNGEHHPGHLQPCAARLADRGR